MEHTKRIEQMAYKFRAAIEDAKDNGEFYKLSPFDNFPRACCGDASDLLAEFLLENGIQPRYVCGTYRDDNPENYQSHAWLITERNIIVDITGDQFKYDRMFLNYNKPVYVGPMDKFHRLFEVRPCDISVHGGIKSLGSGSRKRMYMLYGIIKEYL